MVAARAPDTAGTVVVDGAVVVDAGRAVVVVGAGRTVVVGGAGTPGTSTWRTGGGGLTHR